jgi:hypothetical protein
VAARAPLVAGSTDCRTGRLGDNFGPSFASTGIDRPRCPAKKRAAEEGPGLRCETRRTPRGSRLGRAGACNSSGDDLILPA